MFNSFTHQVIGKDSKLFSEHRGRIFDFLQSHPVGVLSMISPEATPHGSVIYFVVGKDNTIGFITKKLTNKYRNLSNDNQVMLTTFDPLTQTTVNVTGTTQEVHDASELNAIAGAVMRASLKTTTASSLPITKIKAGAYAAFQIKPSSLHMSIFGGTNKGDHEEFFESIESFELEQAS